MVSFYAIVRQDWEEHRLHYRTYDRFTEGLLNTESVIKICMMAFPSLWVSCNNVVGSASCWYKITTQYFVSLSLLICFLCYPDLMLPMPLTGSEYAWFILVFWPWLDPPCAFDREWVLLECLVYFGVLTWPFWCPQQFVCASCMLSLF